MPPDRAERVDRVWQEKLHEPAVVVEEDAEEEEVQDADMSGVMSMVQGSLAVQESELIAQAALAVLKDAYEDVFRCVHTHGGGDTAKSLGALVRVMQQFGDGLANLAAAGGGYSKWQRVKRILAEMANKKNTE